MIITDLMVYDPAGALRELYGHTWCIQQYLVGGHEHWDVRRWHRAPEAAHAYRVADAWAGPCTSNQLWSWLHRQERAMAAYQAST